MNVYGKRLSDLGETKLIDLDYDDILMVVVMNEFAFLLNYNTGEQKYEMININSLKFEKEW